MSLPKPTVVEALSGVMEDVGAVRKGDRNTVQNFSFRGIDAVVNACSPALRKRKVVVVPELLTIERSTVEVGQKRSIMGHVAVTVAYTFYGPAGDSLRSVVAAESFDSGDKATPKAMSVAFRTALLQALCLPTDEPDPDEHSYVRSDAALDVPAGPPQPPAEKWAEFCTAIAACADEHTVLALSAAYARQGIADIPYLAENGVTLAQKVTARIDELRAEAREGGTA